MTNRPLNVVLLFGAVASVARGAAPNGGNGDVVSDALSSLGEITRGITRDFNMNMEFQLRKLGIKLDDIGTGNSTKCFGSLGCLHLTEHWFGISRPVNVMPQEREVVNTQFMLYTRQNRDAAQILAASEPATISSSNFKASRDTKVIIHGFIDTGFVPWCKEMSDALLDYGDLNVLVVDWGGGSTALYSQAAANTRLVALEVAAMVEALMNSHDGAYPASAFHIIGHSLGSHIAGYVGEALKERKLGLLGRISGLDPAEPLFQSMPEFVRLDPGDAQFVDAIHTDAKSILMFGYGMEQPVGHVDFYPNGGTDQPGCSFADVPVSLDSMVGDTDRSVDSVKRHMIACSHNRAIPLYIESLREDKDCAMVATQCNTYEQFKMGLCFGCGEDGRHCAIMGHRAIEHAAVVRETGAENKKFYLNTGSAQNHFCQHHYVLELQLANPKEAERWVQGFLSVDLHGERTELTQLELTQGESQRLIHGARASFLLTSASSLGAVRAVTLRWQYDHELDPLDLTKVCVFGLCSDHLFIRNVTVRSLQRQRSNAGGGAAKEAWRPKESYVVMCGSSEENFVELESESSKLFYLNC